jgi:hypothetical protein
MTQVLRPETRARTRPVVDPRPPRPHPPAPRIREVDGHNVRIRRVGPAILAGFDLAALVGVFFLIDCPTLTASYVVVALMTLAVTGTYRARLTLRALEAARGSRVGWPWRWSWSRRSRC